jgi:hypothetical protein
MTQISAKNRKNSDFHPFFHVTLINNLELASIFLEFFDFPNFPKNLKIPEKIFITEDGLAEKFPKNPKNH